MKRNETDFIYKKKLPKIEIVNNNAKKFDHFVSTEDRKVKNITLAHFNKYINDYTKTLKYPSSNYFSTEKLKHSIPFNYLSNINLNKNLNFLSTLNVFNFDKKAGMFKTNINNNNSPNKIKLISYSNYETQNINFAKKFYQQKSDDEILKYFIEGTFLRKPECLKYIGINEKNIYPRFLNINDFRFYNNYLDNIHKNENLTEHKSKKFDFSDSNNEKMNFNLDLKSILFKFEEINVNINNKKEDIKIDKENNNIIEIDYDTKNKSHSLCLPFRYLPLIFLFTYSNFKSFISEIISYDSENNKFKFVEKKDFEDIIKKYSQNCKNKLATYREENNSRILNDCILYENEFHYNNEFIWMIFNDKNKETKIFKFEIVFPLISFEMSNLNILFQRYASKWLFLELLKENFSSWDRYLLFCLFMNKKFRNTISDILNKKKVNKIFLIQTQFVGPVITGQIAKKNNFDFFFTEIFMNQFNHYYFIIPYQAFITRKGHDKNDINDFISLQLNNARKIHELSKYFGLMGIFYKSMFYNKSKKRFYFSLKFLDDINESYFLFLKEQKKLFLHQNNEMKNIFNFNGNEYHLVIKDCCLAERKFDITSNEDLRYFKIPEKLYKFILGNNISEKKIIENLINIRKDLTNLDELEDKTISISKTKSFKSFKRKGTHTFKMNNKQSNNSKNKIHNNNNNSNKNISNNNNSNNNTNNNKTVNFFGEKKSEISNFNNFSGNLKKLSSFRNIKLASNK